MRIDINKHARGLSSFPKHFPLIVLILFFLILKKDVHSKGVPKTFTLICMFKEKDSVRDLKLQLLEEYYSPKENQNKTRTYVPIQVNNTYQFSIEIAKNFFYFTLILNEKPLLHSYVAKQGDTVLVSIDKLVPEYGGLHGNGRIKSWAFSNLKFTGKGHNLYDLQFKLKLNQVELNHSNDSVQNPFDTSRIDFINNTWKLVRSYRNNLTFINSNQFGLIEQGKTDIPTVLIDIIKADLIGKLLTSHLKVYYTNIGHSWLKKDPNAYAIYEQYLLNHIPQTIPDDRLVFSAGYIEFLNNFIPYQAARENKSQYEFIKTKFNGILREKLLYLYFMNVNTTSRKSLQEELGESLSTFTNKGYVEEIKSFNSLKSIGSKFYDFSLPDTLNKLFMLSDFKGKIILIDFWFTGCGGCAEFFKNDVLPAKKHFRNNPLVQFVSICVDKDRLSWLKSIKGLNGYKYTDSDAVNLYTIGKGRDHELLKYYNIAAFPAVFILNRDGIIMSNKDSEVRGNGGNKLIRMIEQAMN